MSWSPACFRRSGIRSFGVGAVGVGDDDPLAAGRPDPGLERGAVATVRLMPDDPGAGASHSLVGSVLRAVVYDDDLVVVAGLPHHGPDFVHRLGDGILFVVGRDDDAYDPQVLPRVGRRFRECDGFTGDEFVHSVLRSVT
jgi:hypothetical protein